MCLPAHFIFIAITQNKEEMKYQLKTLEMFNHYMLMEKIEPSKPVEETKRMEVHEELLVRSQWKISG